MAGRGAWPVNGTGGTKAFRDSSRPGPYYFIGSGKETDTRNGRAVHLAVKAYQRALNRRTDTYRKPTGIYTAQFASDIEDFQKTLDDVTPWGGIGPGTSKALLKPDIEVPGNRKQITVDIVAGTVNHESMWDAGAIGYLDKDDVGLAQINGKAHPDYSFVERLQPAVAYEFVVKYYENALDQLDYRIRDAIASYNLGVGGARRWISQGRPEWYTPTGATRPRNVWAYIESILAG